jgi:hypothetical protein
MDTMGTAELRRIGQGHCPDCNHRGFCIGPQAGLNINIECGNLDCRARFNVAFYASSVVTGHRLPKASEGGDSWASDPVEPAPAPMGERVPNVLLTQLGKEAALAGLADRRRQYQGAKVADNETLPAGSPMYFQCTGCGAPIVVPEDYLTKPSLCSECQALRDLGWLKE